MATAAELMAYQGNSGLGLGSNPQIPVTSGDSLETTNLVLRDIAAREAQKDILRWQQNVNDQKNLMTALSEGEIKVGDVLERDMPMVKRYLDKQTEAYRNWMKKGYGDIDGAIGYKKATQEAKDVVTQAEARKVFSDKENELMTTDVIPKFVEARKNSLEKNLGNFWGDLVPFVGLGKLNLDPIQKFATPTVQSLTDPTKPYHKGTQTTYSYKDALKNASEYALTPEGMHNLKLLQDAFSDLPQVELMATVDGVNKALDNYNKEVGTPNNDIVKPISIIKDPQTGKLHIDDEGLAALAAKISLSGVKPYNAINFEVDEKALKIGELERKIKEDAMQDRHNRAIEGLQRSGINLRLAEFNRAKQQDQENAASVISEALDILRKGVETTTKLSGGRTRTDLKVSDPFVLQKFGNIDKDGNITNVPDAARYDKDKNQFILQYYDKSFTPTESVQNLIEREVPLDQRAWLKTITERTVKGADAGFVNSLVDKILKKNGNNLYKMSLSGVTESGSSKASGEAADFLQENGVEQ